MSGTAQSTILIVGGARENLTVPSDLPHPHYRVRVATSGEKALRHRDNP